MFGTTRDFGGEKKVMGVIVQIFGLAVVGGFFFLMTIDGGPRIAAAIFVAVFNILYWGVFCLCLHPALRDLFFGEAPTTKQFIVRYGLLGGAFVLGMSLFWLNAFFG